MTRHLVNPSGNNDTRFTSSHKGNEFFPARYSSLATRHCFQLTVGDGKIRPLCRNRKGMRHPAFGVRISAPSALWYFACIGNYAEFWVGPLYLGRTKGEADPGLVHLFRDSDQTVLEGKKSDLPFNRRLWFDHVKDDETVTTFFYHAPVPVVRERLNLKGYTVATALSAVSLCLELAATFYDSWRWHFEALAGATGEDWFAGLKWIKDNEQLSENVRAELDGPAGELLACMRGVDWFGYPGPDLNVPPRLALEICRDTDEFFCDKTDLLLAADISAPEDAFSFLGNLSLEGSSPTGKTIIITEGRSDAWIIADSLKLLYPHLADQFTFMDFEGARVGGGAGSLANILKAFAGAGIVNKTLGIFDNDTAGEAAIRTLRGIALPPNIVALKLPDLESLRSYPTIGPSGEVAMDVNGMAASLELYLGRDVLVDENSKMTPVQWTGYDTSLRKYQGEVLLKDKIQERFHNRLQACVADPHLLQTTNWFGMRAILSAIFRAFHELDGKQILSSLNDHFQLLTSRVAHPYGFMQGGLVFASFLVKGLKFVLCLRRLETTGRSLLAAGNLGNLEKPGDRRDVFRATFLVQCNGGSSDP